MTPVAMAKHRRNFDPHAFLATIGNGRKTVAVPKEQTVFSQGDGADAVFYIQKGKVKLTVVSKSGKEATIGILSAGSFLAKARWPARFSAWDPRPH